MRRHLSLAIAALGLMGTVADAQTQLIHPSDSLPSYDVTTIIPWHGTVVHGADVRTYVQNAFGIDAANRLIGPEWIDRQSYLIRGTMSPSMQVEFEKMSPAEQLMTYRLLQQSLLATRFRMKWHFETRQMTIYELVRAAGGVKLKETENTQSSGSAAIGSLAQFTELTAVSAPIGAIISKLATDAEFRGAPILDKTGLTGKYDVQFNWAPSKLSVVLEDQLGLKLVKTSAFLEVVVIDHIELPSEIEGGAAK